ncbi:MAG: methionyl-tRNA formyltransferase, partial [Candidatus Lindowbacteria bacterium]|nr:methionyl-tRNA formyltransferase [Candidatus Lindowbacteria bacterium]
KVKPLEEEAGEGKPGEVLFSKRGRLVVWACGGAVELLEVQPPGGKRMSVEEYLRGHAIEEGAFFGG